MSRPKETTHTRIVDAGALRSFSTHVTEDAMNMPGFTATASLFPSDQTYAGYYPLPSSDGAVAPMFLKSACEWGCNIAQAACTVACTVGTEGFGLAVCIGTCGTAGSECR